MYTSRQIVVGAALAAASSVVGIAVGSGWIAAADDSAAPAPVSTSAAKDYTKNAYGLIVGSPTDADLTARNLPDLVPATFRDGTSGYLRADEIYLPDPKTPGEAVKQMETLFNDQNQMVVNVYGPDGKTKLGRQVLMTRSEGGGPDDSGLP